MLWASGGFILRVFSNSPAPAAIVSVATPFAVIGRTAGSTLMIDDPAVSSRHAYLHLDHRGLFAVDLATRTGTRVGNDRAPAGWLTVGDHLEIADREIEILEIHLDGGGITDPNPRNPLDDIGDAELVRLTLYPENRPRDPLLLNSELVFVGRSPSCAVTIDNPSAMRVQCVLVRSTRGAYAVDLVGRGNWKNQRPLRGVESLQNGDSLMIGSTRFQCRIELPGSPRTNLPALSLGTSTSTEAWPTELVPSELATAPPLQMIPAEAQAAVLGWLMGQLQSRQDEGTRRQAEFQVELVRLVAEIHRDNHAILNRHLERADSIHRELYQLRDEMKRRFGETTPPVSALAAPRPLPLNIAPVAPPEDPEAAANWLINRVNQLDQENRKGWKDLLGRLSGRKED
jgi:pSer/pThr/pTyr-binding forkhead associated (FHA) protein